MSDTWYYNTDGTIRGPVDTQTLQRMVRAGQLQAQHMVWRLEMADWAQAGGMPELFAQPQPAPPIPLEPAAPRAEQVLETAPTGLTTYGDEYSEGLVWRIGKILMMHKGAKLPLRCARTNEPVEKLTERKLVWLPTPSLALGVIGSLFRRKTATIMIGLSKRTIRRRRIAISVGWLGALTGIVLTFAGSDARSAWITLSGVLVLVVTPIYALVRGRTVSASRIDDYHVYLKGCCQAYLDAFPPLPAGATGLR